MSIVDIHVAELVEGFVSTNNPYFESVYGKIENDRKSEYKLLLKYIHEILTQSRMDHPNAINSLHLNFEGDFDVHVKNLIAEFVTIEQFEYCRLNDSLANNTHHYVQQHIDEWNAELTKLIRCPDGASGNKGGNKVFKNWLSAKNNGRKLLGFYNGLEATCSLNPRVIINCEVNLQKELLDTFKFRPFLIEANQFPKRRSYCVTNTQHTLNELDSLNLVDNFEVVILFDCEQKGIMANFSLEELTKWNQDFNTFFKHCIVITFGKNDTSYSGIRNKIELIRNRFKIPHEFCYTILSSEAKLLTNKKSKVNIPMNFYGPEYSVIWDEYIHEITVRELYELRSVKLMNVLSVTYNEEIKRYIIDDIFSTKDEANLISNSTKQAILELRKEDHKLIEESLIRVLDFIIQLNLKDSITEKLRYDSKLLVSDVILKDTILKSKFSSALNLSRNNQLLTWQTVDTSLNGPIIILSYRDQGHPPYHFFPNLAESTFPNTEIIDPFFINIFFSRQFAWSKYTINCDLAKYLNHSIRRNNFEWKRLEGIIDRIRPQANTNIDWRLEGEYTTSENRETIRVKFLTLKKTRAYYPTDLFIVKFDSRPEYRVEKVNDLLKLDFKEIIFIQNLDEIQEDINLYEKIIDVKQQEDDLKKIRSQFDIKDTDPSKIWKIMLKTIADNNGDAGLYKELDEFLMLRKLRMVSFQHFKNSWISLQSDSISPISNKVFMAICEYLHIPRIYYLIIRRIKNASKQASRQSSRQMNLLLRDLFNDGCFDVTSDLRAILTHRLSYYYSTHPIDELGIDEKSLLDTLITLVELILPELKLLQIESIEIVE